MEDSTFNAVLAVAAVLASGAWTAFRASAWYKSELATRYQWILRIAVSVVRMGYHNWVRSQKAAVKEADPSAKLSDADAKKARDIAVSALREKIATQFGPNPSGMLGEMMTDDTAAMSMIELAVQVAKNPDKFPEIQK